MCVKSKRWRARPAIRAAKARANGRKSLARAEKNANLVALEKRISDALGLVVNIDDRGRGGVLSIRYRSLDQLDEVLRRLEKTLNANSRNWSRALSVLIES